MGQYCIHMSLEPPSDGCMISIEFGSLDFVCQWLVLNGVDLPEFFEIQPDMAENGKKTLPCTNHQQFYF